MTTAIVTGASRGLGRAIALELARRGAFIFACYRRRRREAEETLRMIEELGGGGELVEIELGGPSAESTLRRAIESTPRIDVLVNNAGVARDNLFPLLTDEDWREVFSVNVMGAVACCRAVACRMIHQRSGSIINVASVAGLRASPGQSNYSASKGALISLTRTMAAELAKSGVRVNAVVPGMVEAGMALRLDREIAKAHRERIPLHRFAKDEEIARAVAFLASEDASYVVGQTLVVDGGLSL